MTDASNTRIEATNRPERPTHPRDVPLLGYWRILVARRLVFLTCLGVVVATAMILTFLATPKYTATTTLKIERQTP